MIITTVIEHNAGLSIGDKVKVFWTCSFRDYAADGTITKVNKSSAKVAIDHDPSGDYPDGFIVTQNLCNFNTMTRWSWANSIRPQGVVAA